VQDASNDVEGKNSLFADKGATHCDVSHLSEHKVCSLSTKLYKCDTFQKDWLWGDPEKYVSFSSYASADNEPATGDISAIRVVR
jgi:hypothetical protein